MYPGMAALEQQMRPRVGLDHGRPVNPPRLTIRAYNKDPKPGHVRRTPSQVLGDHAKDGIPYFFGCLFSPNPLAAF